MNVKSFKQLAFACFTIVLNTGNLCQLRFVNNEDLPNTGNLDYPEYFTGRCDPTRRRTKRCQRRKSLGWGELGCLRLHLEHFEKLGISQTFNLQK